MTPFNRSSKPLLGVITVFLAAALIACGGGSSSGNAVTSIVPPDAATEVAINSAVVASFSKPIDPTTLNGTTFLVKQGPNLVAGTVSFKGLTASFQPSQELAPGRLFIASITGAKYLPGEGLVSTLVWSFTTAGVRVGPAPVLLGTSANYVILAQSAITNVPASAITGDIAISPAAESYLTGFAQTDAIGYATAPQVVGRIFAADQAVPTPSNLTTAVSDMGTAYTDAAGRPTPDFLELGTGAIGGMTLAPGLYKWTSGVTISSDVTLAGNATDVWIFQTSGTLIQSSGTRVLLSGGAQAKNIFWQVADAVTLGTTSHFEGIILAQTAIALQTGATMNGRALAQTAVTLDQNTVTQPVSGADTTPPTVTSTNPLATAAGVAPTAGVSVTFSKAMTSATLIDGFTLAAGVHPIAGSVTCLGNTATFHPAALLPDNTALTATIAAAVKDLDGNALAASYSWSFTTAALPAVTSTNPLSNATGVAPYAGIAATFSKSMNPLTITSTSFTVSASGVAVSGSVRYNSLNRTATFQATNSFAVNTLFTAKIASGSSGVADLAGNRLLQDFTWTFTSAVAHSSPALVLLGASANYVILAETAITNVPTSAIKGDVAISPAAQSYLAGFVLTNAIGYATATEVVGKVYAADQAAPTPSNLTTAIKDMGTAYTDAAGRPSPDFLELGTGAIGGMTLAPGLYKWAGTVSISSNLTLTGSANDVWIFQISGDLTEGSATKVFLAGGALAKNIFWQVAGAVTLGTTSHFEGIVLSQTAIILQTGASLNGRALAQSAVVLDSNTVTQPAL